jgi:phosphatidate cytidylyltransferase
VLKQRLLVAAVGLPLLALLIAAPERMFSAIVMLILAAAAYELVRAGLPDMSQQTALTAGAATGVIAATARGVPEFQIWTLLPALAVALAVVLPRDRKFRNPVLTWWVLAVLYTAALGAHFLLLRNLDDGQRWLLVLLAGTFATDTGAYAVGRLLGRHRMAPSISPGKTWEGAIGGLVFGASAAAAAIYFLALAAEPFGSSLPSEPSLNVLSILAIALALPPAAIAGDLLESALKRRIDVKDMSQLLPGHGGLLDRLDSLLLTAPTLYWLAQWLIT